MSDLITVYKVSKQNQINVIKKSRLYYLLFFASPFSCFFTDIKFCIYFTLVIFIPILIQFIIHLDYYINDRNKEIEINFSDRIITIKKNNIKESFSFNDVKSILIQKGHINASSDPKALPFSFYNYYTIKLLNDKEYVFTDLLCQRLNVFELNKLTKSKVNFINII
ncbi:hypothetical protein [Flavobacterium terrigena]|uniref:PH domain-containing protein n=1 Tax=Flavobacterium terrigena TaxID=402734 RepID=A0A1H6RQZ4_9FLAO|nr:hypothetical protein [Flavobacterium terrigena]SEI58181.1 hypothetical protein SAMN05660918_1020 [Flavobacterium terrigena]